MAKETFNIDFRTGSLIEKHSNSKGVNVGNKITKQEKGLAYAARQANSGQVTYAAADMTALNFGTGAFSLVCAFRMGKFIHIGSAFNTIFGGQFDVASKTDGVIALYNSSQILTFYWGAGGATFGGIALSDSGSLYDGKYHLVILDFDGTTYRAYLDNIKEGNESTDIFDINFNEFVVGRGEFTSRRSNSDIAYIRAYDTALTQAERNDLMTEFLHSFGTTEQKRGFEKIKPTDLSNVDGLVAGYSMVPSSGGVLVDLSGNNNNGTITGALSTKDGMAFDGVDDSVDCSDDSSLDFGSGVFSVAVRAKNTSGGADHRALVSKGLYNDGWIFYIYDRELRFANHEDYTTLATTETYTDDLWHTFIVVREANDDGVLYVDGIEVKRAVDFFVGQDTDSTIKMMIGSENEGATKFFDGEMEDVKVYNSALSAQQAKDYNNSFIKPTIRESFSDSGADGIVKLPKGWIDGTGDYKVEELAIEEGELITTPLSVTNGFAHSGSGVYEYTTNGSTSYLYQASIVTIGKRYKLKYTIDSNSNSTVFGATGAAFNAQVPSATVGIHSYDLTANITDALYFAVLSSEPSGLQISNISITEIPPLPDFDTGTKYLECDSAGTIAIPNKNAYGRVFEGVLYKGADGNRVISNFISDRTNASINNFDGYNLLLNNDEAIYLAQRAAPSTTNVLFNTAASYFNINTWYRLKVTRTTDGEFTVLIKGGSFTATIGYDGWTLVQPTGESLSGDPLVYTNNPVTDNTYTTSEYLVADLDAGDKITNLLLTDQVKQ